MNHLAISLTLHKIKLFANSSARRGDTVFVNQADLPQFLHHDRNPARFVKVLRDILSAGLEVDEVRGVPEDLADVIQKKLDTGLMGDGGQMQARVG